MIPSRRPTLATKEQARQLEDNYAVAILLEDILVGHVPHNLAQSVSQFLQRDANKEKIFPKWQVRKSIDKLVMGWKY